MVPMLKLSKSVGVILADAGIYRPIVGHLMYLTITRPNITFAVNEPCLYSSALWKSHLKVIYKVLLYIKRTTGQGLFYIHQWFQLRKVPKYQYATTQRL